MSDVSFEEMQPYYTRYWAGMQIKPEREVEFNHVAARLRAHADAYEAVEHDTGVPWEMVAVMHEREAGGDFDGCLANGDPWREETTHVPAGYGPWKSWHDAAVWALKREGMTGKPKEFWTVERMLYYCESFNGFGYWLYHGHMPSPYVWGGTTIQKRGKYVGDGEWDGSHWDQQLGCAGMLKLLMAQDTPIPAPPSPPPVPSEPKPSVVVSHPVRTSFWGWLATLFGWKK